MENIKRDLVETGKLVRGLFADALLFAGLPIYAVLTYQDIKHKEGLKRRKAYVRTIAKIGGMSDALPLSWRNS